MRVIIVYIFGLLFCKAIISAEGNNPHRDVIKMRKSIAKIKTRFSFYPEHYITGPRSSR